MKFNIYNIIDELKIIIDNPVCELNYSNKFELVCAVMLSAQTTDAHVNKITPLLFSKYPNPFSMSNALQQDIIDIIKPLGLSKNKSLNLIEISKRLCNVYNGDIPNNLDDLMSLKGVGRKTANVVLALGFNVPTIAVDTHVKRVSRRLGLALDVDDEYIIEHKLMDLLNKEDYILSHHLLLLFGRRYCLAKNPKCEICNLKKYCNYKR